MHKAQNIDMYILRQKDRIFELVKKNKEALKKIAVKRTAILGRANWLFVEKWLFHSSNF